ncbi:DUF4870 domain-containing protein [Natrinema ejinorense]|uniref:Acyltransferase n=1 Tax=Natrinema ejinorense TaxID=373386 RepID=A0A2A5QXI9_9EURY|nr:DUF4870 domain-containing protein [Natrinema ejinorense]PCR91562.1 acyltransferase [Natrinema ejinorense]
MSSNTQTPSHGPELLTDRSIAGIAVHPLAFLTGIIGAGFVYVVSTNEFTRVNARNALNWHLSVLVLSVVAVVTFVLGADELTVAGEAMELSVLPTPLETVAGLVGTVLLLAAGFAWLLTGLFTAIATVKAIFGTPWEYPLARDIVKTDI